MDQMAEQIELVRGPLAAADAAAVTRLARAAEHVDGVAPLSEQPRLWLTEPQAPAAHLLVRAADDVAGYAQLDLAVPAVASAELFVHPFARRHGVGTGLLGAARRLADGDGDGRELRVWAHGDLPTAQAFAAAHGMTAVRELLRMDLALAPAPAPRELPPDVQVRPFAVGRDEQAWLALNAAAFAHHPEQGRLTLADLQAREREDWFDPETFWLAWRGPDLVGAVWAKVTDEVGELYVVAVSPALHGQGLGGALTDLALHRLGQRGLVRAELFTDGDNAAAVRTYTRAGFTIAARDTQYAAPADPG